MMNFANSQALIGGYEAPVAAYSAERELFEETDGRQYNAEEEASYQRGFEFGLSWEYDYIPGGPWICTIGSNYSGGDPEWQAYREQTAIQNRAFIRGFHAGIAKAAR